MTRSHEHGAPRSSMSSDQPIYVTRPYLPPLSEVIPLLEEIWKSRIVTNHGPMVQRFEGELRRYLGVPHVSVVTNGMLALETGIEACGLEGEVITTPYSFVATTHAVHRARVEPVFVDVRPTDLNIDPAAVEAAITPQTSAIVAVHCYGNPCAVEALDAIAARHGLALIYDAAHAFGVRYRGESLLSWGDISSISFHGTKAFNTFEGGAVVARTPELEQNIALGRNFGITSETSIQAIGTNAKMSEFNAALGIVQLRHFAEARQARKRVDARYRAALEFAEGVEPLPVQTDTECNYAYFPVLITSDCPISRDALYDRLKENGIFSRRYFYPLLSNLPMYQALASAAAGNLPVANRAAHQILCLPIYHDLREEDQERIIRVICEAILQ